MQRACLQSKEASRYTDQQEEGDTIGQQKDATGNKDDTRGQSKRPWHRKATDIDKTDMLVKRVVRATSPVCREDECKMIS